MIEFVLGVLIFGAGCAAALGLMQPYVPVPITLSLAYLIAASGAAMAAHGLFRALLKKHELNRHWFRMRGLTALCLASTSAIIMLALLGAPFFNAFRISGMPLGYYAAAQGALIGLVILAFYFASRAESIDADDERGEA